MTIILFIIGFIVLMAILSKSKLLRIVFLIVSALALALFIWLLRLDGKWEIEENAKKLQQEMLVTQNWNALKAGDSVFVKSDKTITNFYKKGREKLDESEQKQTGYQKNDTSEFFKINAVHEKYFYLNNSSFIGICLGKDSTQTKEGLENKHRWVRVKPNYKITQLKNTNEFDYSHQKWENNTGISSIDNTLEKDFYLKFTDISEVNNDSVFIKNQSK